MSAMSQPAPFCCAFCTTVSPTVIGLAAGISDSPCRSVFIIILSLVAYLRQCCGQVVRFCQGQAGRGKLMFVLISCLAVVCLCHNASNGRVVPQCPCFQPYAHVVPAGIPYDTRRPVVSPN